MMRQRVGIVVFPLLAAGLLTQAGCSHPDIPKRLAHRRASIRSDFDHVAKLEARRPAGIASDLFRIKDKTRRDAENTGPAIERYGRFFTRDFERYEERMCEYRNIAAKLIAGKPEVALDPLLMLY